MKKEEKKEWNKVENYTNEEEKEYEKEEENEGKGGKLYK